MYKVIKAFADLHDNNHNYQVGDVFPRAGVSVKDERVAELAGSDNKQETPLIESIDVNPVEETEKVEKEPRKRASKKVAGEAPAE